MCISWNGLRRGFAVSSWGFGVSMAGFEAVTTARASAMSASFNVSASL